MNWGSKLVVVFVLFGAFIFYMVYRSVTTQVDLVSKDYYKDEIAYQQVIDGKQNANNLTGNVVITQQQKNIIITLPEEMKGKNCTGTIYLYSPANEKFDITVPLKIDAAASQIIDAGAFKAKAYTIKINWEAAGKKYFFEKPIILNK